MQYPLLVIFKKIINQNTDDVVISYECNQSSGDIFNKFNEQYRFY
jgi:hypothetical protein